MGRQRSHSIEFKRQVAQEFIAGESLYALSKRHDISRQLVRVWVQKYEAGALDEDAQAADLLQEYEAKIAALERMVPPSARNRVSKGGSEKRTAAEKREYIRHCRPRGATPTSLPEASSTGRPLILFRIMRCAASNTEELSFTDTTFRVVTSTAFIADLRLPPASQGDLVNVILNYYV